MTNKPMLSVERELRALAEKACGTAKDSPEYRRFLEAVNPTIVLDLTAEPAAQHQGEPVTDDQLIEAARKAALNSTHRYSYMPATQEDASNWVPHRWVVEAMRDVASAEQPAPVAAVLTRKMGFYGKAYDLPETKRAYTYEDQPGNMGASKLGRAACLASSGGDSIDHGLSLLKALSDEGFGVFELDRLNGVKP